MNERRASGRKVLVVGNYAPDGQESMLRFARMLEEGLRSQGMAVETVEPRAWFGRLGSGPAGVGKWLAYLDKYLVFPWILRRRTRRLGAGGVVHIADHSNAMYTRPAARAGHPVVITCHDLGAVRGARGEDTDCPASRLGKVLQAWIVRSLGEADALPCVSTATQRDVERLVRRRSGLPLDTPVIFNGLNVPYGRLTAENTRARLETVGFVPGVPFVLNVGSGLSRKNRDGVLRIFARVKDRWPEGRLVFAGEALTEAERTLARTLGVSEKVAGLVKPANDTLEALYNGATCLLFPSKFEGFGWPVVEAQACGCPVLCSDAGSLAEIAGGAAFVRHFRDEEAFAEEVLRLTASEEAHRDRAEAGFRNAERFGTAAMTEKYRRLYEEVSRAVPIGETEAAA